LILLGEPPVAASPVTIEELEIPTVVDDIEPTSIDAPAAAPVALYDTSAVLSPSAPSTQPASSPTTETEDGAQDFSPALSPAGAPAAFPFAPAFVPTEDEV
jgi:hypothetical protein